LGIRCLFVEADAVIEAGYDDIVEADANSVLPLECSGYITDVLFDIPDAFAAASLITKNIYVVDVTLRMIASDEVE